MERLTEEELDRIDEALAEVGALSNGGALPWRARPAYRVETDEDCTHIVASNGNRTVAEVDEGADATLIENAPRWLAALVAEVREGRR